ncbi:hypothetical protein ATPR_2700 [Acetobacter tropicalis NBRC 101654]|uniref:Uncharacterized protein n=1 Tax=Acetobacter tropicalis NBRC 101654 TaxID=749388 RepID=F7VH51_9PROT|nr:hypothetical protein ATPR_2700 [Acetobacter tropicalis NBRC 101654]
MREAFMNEFLLVMIDRLSTQNKTTQNRQAAVAFMSDID